MNINDMIRNFFEELIERTIAKKKINIEYKFDNNISLINGEPHQLEQVLLNLIINASDAMPDGGTITIEISFQKIDDASIIHPLLLPGDYVVLSVTDTGTGIPEKIRYKIFEPFFTTKDPGKGTGLGLTMVYGIVKAHEGVIKVKSEEGKGSTFEIYFSALKNISPEKGGQDKKLREKIL